MHEVVDGEFTLWSITAALLELPGDQCGLVTRFLHQGAVHIDIVTFGGEGGVVHIGASVEVGGFPAPPLPVQHMVTVWYGEYSKRLFIVLKADHDVMVVTAICHQLIRPISTVISKITYKL